MRGLENRFMNIKKKRQCKDCEREFANNATNSIQTVHIAQYQKIQSRTQSKNGQKT